MAGRHHENWDGTGYPKGLAGATTPLCARIVHVADAYDAMTSDRPYRRGMSHQEAIGVLERYAGTQFDPAIVKAFVKQRPPEEATENDSIQNLAEAVNGPGAVPSHAGKRDA
ncbi:MAG: HD domain-containing protein [Acidobacteria bacterium]|nr:HD domain-containing protein [Acidobacteriota bacterium]